MDKCEHGYIKERCHYVDCQKKREASAVALSDGVMLTNGERLFLLKLINEEYSGMTNGRRKATTLKFDRYYSLKRKLEAKEST